MGRANTALVLQSIGPEAALLRVRPDGKAARGSVEVLGRWRRATGGRDEMALTDDGVKAALAECVRSNRLTGKPVRLLLGGHAIACHRLTLPVLPREAAHKAIRLKLSNVLPYDMAGALLAIDAPAPRGREHAYRVASAPAELARSACAAVTGAALTVEDVHPVPAAVEEMLVSRIRTTPDVPVAAAYLGESGTTLVICHHGAAAAVNELPPALMELTAALMRPIIAGDHSITLKEAEARALRNSAGIPAIGTTVESLGIPAERVLPLLEPVLQQWARVLTQWLTFAATSEVKEPIARLCVCGPGAAIPGLARALNGRVPVPVEAETDAGTDICTNDVDAAAVDRASLWPSLGAAINRFELPSLLPPDLRRTRRVASGMRVAGLCGTALAAACVLATTTFWRMGGGLAVTLAAHESEMVGTRKQLHELRGLLEQERQVARLQQELATFTQCTPQWSGVLKELARALPPPLVLRRVSADRKKDGIELQLTAKVFADNGGSGIDALMQRTLRELQASAFFENVEVVSALQPGPETAADAGELRLRMRVVHVTTLERARQPGMEAGTAGGEK